MKGVICVGTADGAFIVYGECFQYMVPFVGKSHTSAVRFIVITGEDSCLVFYRDNCVAMFRLPFLKCLQILPSSWMEDASIDGDVTAVHVDEYSDQLIKTFVYVGTSSGKLLVLEVLPSGDVRVCHYTVGLRDVELTGEYKITAILSVSRNQWLAITFRYH